jgi:DNA-binding transcriptional regulator LsrR (DeoR family)
MVAQTSGEGEPVTVSGGPARLVSTASVARRYYLDGKSKVEIADELGLSRFQIARLLDSARASGLVRIEIAAPGAIDVELSSRLQDILGLQHAVVVDVPDTKGPAALHELGQAAADLLSEIVTPADVLGLAWSRAVSAMTNALTRLPAIPVVQLTGALARPDATDNSVDLVRQAARISGGAAHFFYAPTIVSDATTAQALRRQPEVARAIGRFSTVTKAVVGIGSWEPAESTVFDAIEDEACRLLQGHGVCGDVCGVLIDSGGRPIESELAQRTIGITAGELRAIPEVIAVAYNTARTKAVRPAIRGGFVNSLVTHSSMARAMIP